eukprot:s502_g21.t1
MVQFAIRLCFFLVVTWLCESAKMSKLSTEFIDACARELGGKRLLVHFPWENSQFEPMMTKKPRSVIRPPEWFDMPQSEVTESGPGRAPTKLNRYNAKRQMSEVSWVASENHRLNLALQCWKVIILDSTSHTELGQLLIQCIEHGKSDDYIWQVVADSFSRKAAATLKARASSLLAFGRWKKSLSLGSSEGVFPITEEMAYDYLCELRYNKAAPSKGKRFLEAVGFAKGLVGAKVDAVLASSRVKGAAEGTGAKPVRKKCPFTVEQVLILERIAMYCQGQQAIFAGYLCFLIHCRLRWSDGQHCIQEPTIDIDPETGRGFLEAALYHHKTANKRRVNVVRLLPVAAVLPGLTGNNWAEHWLKKRLDMNLRGSMRQPMMPAPTADGHWDLQPLSSSEANVWLRELLGPWKPAFISGMATHSAKATLLSWLSKAHVDIALRRLAGYHITPGDKSALEYSRDAAAPVLRQIEALFIAIRSEVFSPDLPRSRRWSGANSLDEAVKIAASNVFEHDMHGFSDAFNSSLMSFDVVSEVQPDAVDIMEEHDSSVGFDDNMTLEDLRVHTVRSARLIDSVRFSDDASDMSDWSDSRESSTDQDSDSDDMERQVLVDGEKNAVDLVAPSDLAGKICFRHLRSKKLHFVERVENDISIFRCGRKCNANYERLSTVPAFTAHGCMCCFGWSNEPDEAASDPD